jgi:hypothetical protein
MTLDEQDEFIQRIMANRDAEMAVIRLQQHLPAYPKDLKNTR